MNQDESPSAKRHRVLASIFTKKTPPAERVWRIMFIKRRGFSTRGAMNAYAVVGVMDATTGQVAKILSFSNSYEQYVIVIRTRQPVPFIGSSRSASSRLGNTLSRDNCTISPLL